MAKRKTPIAKIEDDDGAPDPRKTSTIIGQNAALANASRAIRSGRPPQGFDRDLIDAAFRAKR